MIRQIQTHYNNTTRIKVQSVYQYFLSHAILFAFRAIFQEFNVKERFDYNIIRSSTSTRSSLVVKIRYTKRKITDNQMNKTHKILQNEELKLKEKRYT